MSKIMLILAALLLIVTSPATAGDLQVAVASNFTEPAKKIAAEFQRETGTKVSLSFGSTGSFYAQIKNGAPFDLLLAADAKTPAKLEKEGEIKPGSRHIYVQGALALWSPKPDLVDAQGLILASDKFKLLALADPGLAPYGQAAQETLAAKNLFEPLQQARRLVTGLNIGQAFQFVESGQVDLGFVAWSQVCQDGRLTRGSVWLVPADLYSPLIQEMVILKKAAADPAAQAFADYLLNNPKAQAIVTSFGYSQPGPKVAQ